MPQCLGDAFRGRSQFEGSSIRTHRQVVTVGQITEQVKPGLARSLMEFFVVACGCCSFCFAVVSRSVLYLLLLVEEEEKISELSRSRRRKLRRVQTTFCVVPQQECEYFSHRYLGTIGFRFASVEGEISVGCDRWQRKRRGLLLQDDCRAHQLDCPGDIVFVVVVVAAPGFGGRRSRETKGVTATTVVLQQPVHGCFQLVRAKVLLGKRILLVSFCVLVANRPGSI
mmetsp:Transcript_24958/g.51100  ORF Transcript_24958/g.51100 Transcript_24958/m.51100 type:complete len:226 (+) Transcript_24958:2106-2783(+)